MPPVPVVEMARHPARAAAALALVSCSDTSLLHWISAPTGPTLLIGRVTVAEAGYLMISVSAPAQVGTT